jgi:predicted PolB exonuclease-like 3'-5' exonuclease
MSIFILDIETKPDDSLIETFCSTIKPSGSLKDPVKIEADIKKKRSEAFRTMACDQDYCDIVCIGIKELGKPGELYTIETIVPWFIEHFKQNTTIITFNGKAFDIPIIIKSGIKKGLDLPYKRLKMMTEKYKNNGHIDLIQECSFNSNNYKSLDAYLRIYLGVQKNISSDDFFEWATEDDIKQHCLEDLQFTEDLYLKFMVVN